MIYTWLPCDTQPTLGTHITIPTPASRRLATVIATRPGYVLLSYTP